MTTLIVYSDRNRNNTWARMASDAESAEWTPETLGFSGVDVAVFRGLTAQEAAQRYAAINERAGSRAHGVLYHSKLRATWPGYDGGFAATRTKGSFGLPGLDGPDVDPESGYEIVGRWHATSWKVRGPAWEYHIEIYNLNGEIVIDLPVVEGLASLIQGADASALALALRI